MNSFLNRCQKVLCNKRRKEFPFIFQRNETLIIQYNVERQKRRENINSASGSRENAKQLSFDILFISFRFKIYFQLIFLMFSVVSKEMSEEIFFPWNVLSFRSDWIEFSWASTSPFSAFLSVCFIFLHCTTFGVIKQHLNILSFEKQAPWRRSQQKKEKLECDVENAFHKNIKKYHRQFCFLW